MWMLLLYFGRRLPILYLLTPGYCCKFLFCFFGVGRLLFTVYHTFFPRKYRLFVKVRRCSLYCYRVVFENDGNLCRL